MLFEISFAVELGALLMAVGLGIYLITRSARRPETWLAALTIWAMGGLFINMLFSLIPPPLPTWMVGLLLFWPRGIFEGHPDAWLEGWTSTLAPAFWFHATMLMRSNPMKRRQLIMVTSGYILAILGIAIQALLPREYKTISGDPLYLNSLQGGPVYGLFLLGLSLLGVLCIRNLVLAARKEPRYLPHRQLVLLSMATLLAGLTGPVGLVTAYYHIPVPMYLIALLIGLGLLVTGFGVARYSALMENRIFQRDFFSTFFIISGTTAIYLWIAYEVSKMIPFPLHVYILVGLIAVISHAFADAGRQHLEKNFLHHERRLLREQLRGIEVLKETELLKGLNQVLESLCEPIQASYAILLVCKNDVYEQKAAYNWRGMEIKMPAADIEADDLRLLQSGELKEPLSHAVLLYPVYLSDHQIGALIIGPAEHGMEYSRVEIDRMQELVDYLGVWLGHLLIQHNGQTEPFEQNLSQEIGLPTGAPEGLSTHTVELALRNLHNYEKLAELPLSKMKLLSQRGAGKLSYIDTGKAVHSLLCEAMDYLRPPEKMDETVIKGAPRREWFPYIILRDAYVDCLPNREIIDRLYISEGTFNRTRRSAIRSLTHMLTDMENGILPSLPAGREVADSQFIQ